MRLDNRPGTDSRILRPPVAGRKHYSTLSIIDEISGGNHVYRMVGSPVVRPVFLQIIHAEFSGRLVIERHGVSAPTLCRLVVIAVLRSYQESETAKVEYE